MARQTETKISFRDSYMFIKVLTPPCTDAHTIYGKTDVFGFIYFQSGLGVWRVGSGLRLLSFVPPHHKNNLKGPPHTHLFGGCGRNHIRQQHKDQKQEQQEPQYQFQVPSTSSRHENKSLCTFSENEKMQKFCFGR